MRPSQRAPDAMRSVTIPRHYTKHAEGSVLVAFGDTRVLCTATLDARVPPFLRDSGKGWVTAEYAMLPRSAQERIQRDAVRKGRALEISRLIGRSIRNVVDLKVLRDCQVILDCDVLQADGGTRTAAVTGAFVALCDAVQGLLSDHRLERSPLLGQCAAVSVGVVEGEVRLDLCYEEDFVADVDLNLVMRDSGEFIEVQASAEGRSFAKQTFDEVLEVGAEGIRQIFAIQKEALERA
ncbi:MAG TPA: ribonuclease PH [Candidatus Hydrogenedentes bacterium]|nr:ribonuclease PH [Candidatus Hydrogenedentota bacterium]